MVSATLVLNKNYYMQYILVRYIIYIYTIIFI